MKSPFRLSCIPFRKKSRDIPANAFKTEITRLMKKISSWAKNYWLGVLLSAVILFFFGKCITEMWCKPNFWESLWNVLALPASVTGLAFNIYWERGKWEKEQEENKKIRFFDFLKAEIAFLEEKRNSNPTEYFKDYVESLESYLKNDRLEIEISEDNKDFIDNNYAGSTQHLLLEERVLALFEKIFEEKLLSLDEKKIYGHLVLGICDLHERAYYLYFAWSFRAISSLEKSRYAFLIPFFNEADVKRVINKDIYAIIRDGATPEEVSEEIETLEKKTSLFMKNIKEYYGRELGEFSKK